MADYGLKVSQPGFDVGTAANRNLVFSTDLPTFLIAMSGSGSIVCTGSSIEFAGITHGLPYAPAYLVYSQVGTIARPSVGTSFIQLPYSAPVGGDSGVSLYADNFIVSIRYGKDIVGTLQYKYTIFYQPSQ